MHRFSPAVIVAAMYALAVGAASFGIAAMWGVNAQLIFMPIAMIGGLIVGRFLV